jgi:hypothetical protein
MARRPTARQRLEALSAKFEPALQAAFLAAIEDLRNGAQIGRIAERLERGDIDGALRALNIEPAAFRLFEEGVREAYISGGIATTTGLPALRDPSGAQVVVRFDARSPGAEAFMRDLSGRRITRMTDDILVAARQHMTQGMVDGRNPRSVALDLVGRINRATGRREGAIIGLSSSQEGFVATARQDLLSGDPASMRHYLGLGRRDKRFDRTVLAAIRDGKPLKRDIIDRMIGGLSDSYLLLRGETIARTEAIGALNASHRESFEQAIASGYVRRQDVRKVWRATRDNRTRDTHRAIGDESVGFDELFSNGLLYPCDPNGPASEVVNCRCSVDYRIDFFANLT